MSTKVSSFETQVVTTLQDNFQSRCALCLCNLEDALQNCHILNNEPTLDIAVQYHLVSSDFSRDSAENGFRLCANCHIGRMTPGAVGIQRLAFVPCREVCAYLLQELKKDKNTTVDAILDAARFNATIQPFLSLYQVLVLHNDPVNHLTTDQLPNPRYFSPASHSFEKTGTGQPFRIFDGRRIPDEAPLRHPTRVTFSSPSSPPLTPRRIVESKIYWRLRGSSAGAFLAIPLTFFSAVSPTMCEPELFELLKYLLATYQSAGGDRKGKRKRRGNSEDDVYSDEDHSDNDNDDQSRRAGPSDSTRSSKTGHRGGKKSGSRGRKDNSTASGSKDKERSTLAPEPKPDCLPREYSEKVKAKWRWGPLWTSNSLILDNFGIDHPHPWRQPKDSTMLVFRY